MKNRVGIIKNGALQLATLFVMVYVVQITPMKVVPENQSHKDEYFIHEMDNPNNGIWIKKEFVKDNSRSIKAMIEDLGGDDLKNIPLNYSVDVIKMAFDVLDNMSAMNNLSLQKLISVSEVFNYLDAPRDKMESITAAIKDKIEKSGAKITGNQELKMLHPDIQREFMTDSAVGYLKNCIMNYRKERKKIVVNNYGDVHSIALFSDGKKFVSGHYAPQNNLIVWDMSNQNNIMHKPLVGHTGPVIAIACSADGKIMVSGGEGVKNNLIVWNMSDPENITHQVLEGHTNNVLGVAISSDGNTIASCSAGNENNLILWDRSNPDNIISQKLIGHAYGVFAVAFSSDAHKIVSGCYGDQKNLIVWDIHDKNKIVIEHELNVSQAGVRSVAFMPGNKKIIVGCFVDDVLGDSNDVKKNLSIWDISNPQHITQQLLSGHPLTVNSIACRGDGKIIFSGCDCDENNLLMWDVSNSNHITYQSLVGCPWTVFGVACSADGKTLVSGGERKPNLIVWKLWTDQEEFLFNQLKNYSIGSVQLIYQLCLQASRGEAIKLEKDSDEYNLFVKLPKDMQTFLINLLSIKISKGKGIGKLLRFGK